jgi:hypothetical protein
MFLPKRIYVLSLSFFIGLISSNVMGQTDINRTINLPKIMPVSPEAASLGKFGQIPVSYYRGVPNISIPLFQVKEEQIDLPVQLSYHAGGIKVEEMASTVGLSWALSAGGVITRTQKGQDDETGYFNNYNQVKQFILGGLTQSEQNSFKVNVYNQYADSEPDIFYYNFGGVSGKFFCADDGKLYTSPRTDLKITYNSSNFAIVDGKGITYKFSTRELTTTEPYIGGGNNDQFQSNTSWYLTQIEDPLGNQIDLTYNNVYTYFRTKAITTFSRALTGAEFGCQDSFSDSYNLVSVERPTIKEISFSTGKIRFDYEAVKRLDAPDTAMRQITLLNLNNDTVKYFRLYTGYYTTNEVGGCEDGYGYRLRLDSLKEFGKNGKSANPYKFTYNADVLPCRLSNAQDHWGYYNAKNNIQFVRYQYGDNGPWYGADKEIDSAAAKTGLLTVMTYPTGGRTEFTYEGNTTSYSVPAGFDPDHPVTIAGLTGNNSNHGGNYLLTFQSTFSVASGDLSPSGYVWATASLSKYIADPNVLSIITITVTGSNGYNKVIQDGDSLHLDAGNYTVTGTIETEYAGNPYCEFALYLSKIPYNPLTYYNKAYGGIRIGQIKDYDFGNHLADVKTYKYNSFDIAGIPTTISSGEYAGNPDNLYYSYTKMNCPPPGNPGSCCSYKIYNSVSNYPLLYSNGSPVGYKNVTVFFGPDGSGGKQEYTYTSYSDYPDQASYSAPFFFASEYDWKKGLLLKSTDYKYESTSYLPVKRVINEYDFHSSDTTKRISRGVVLGKLYDNNMGDSLSILYQLQVASYDVLAEAFNLSRDTAIAYDAIAGTPILQVVNTYNFSPKNFQLKRKQSIDSKGEQLAQNFKYSLDYGATAANNNRGRSLWNLQSKNIISAPIESLVTKIKGGSEYVLYGNINGYRNDLPLIDTVYSLEEKGTTSLSSYQYSSVDGSNNFIFFNTYKPYIVQNRYTSKGKFSELRKNDDHKMVYLWDYNGELAVASVTSADSASVAYSSFEADGKGNWSYTGVPADDPTSPTGIKYYSLGSGPITKSGLLTGNDYIVTYWRKNGSGTPSVNGATGTAIVTKNGWTLFKHQLTGITSITINGSGYIDELRLYPASANMLTNTYNPLIGVSSSCDAANRINYYEYDALGRLSLIRDQDKNILKKFCYNFQGQQEDCSN